MNKLPSGFTAIESAEQLEKLPDGFYLFASNIGTTVRVVKRGEDLAHASSEITPKILAGIYIGFRHIPDTPIESVDDGFEKKTEFRSGCMTTENMMAQHIQGCHDHIDKQAGQIERLNAYAQSLELALNSPAKELAQLKAAREWQPVTLEALEAAPDGTYEFICKKNSAFVAGQKIPDGMWWVAGFAGEYGKGSIKGPYSHFRLITAASDFTPPERKIKIAGGEYTVEQLEKLIGKQ